MSVSAPPSRRGRVLTFVALVVATGVLVGAGVILVTQGDDSTGRAGISVHDAWTAPNEDVTAVYFVVENRGEEDRLVRVTTEAAASASVMGSEAGGTHTAATEDVSSAGLAVPDGTTELRPGGRHLMLEGLTRQLQPGERFSLRLDFERSPAVVVEVEVVTWDEAAERAA